MPQYIVTNTRQKFQQQNRFICEQILLSHAQYNIFDMLLYMRSIYNDWIKNNEKPITKMISLFLFIFCWNISKFKIKMPTFLLIMLSTYCLFTKHSIEIYSWLFSRKIFRYSNSYYRLNEVKFCLIFHSFFFSVLFCIFLLFRFNFIDTVSYQK